MPRNFETTFTPPAFTLDAYIDPTPVNFNDPDAVAECLVEYGDYEGYELDSSFTERDVFELALIDAKDIIATRERVKESRAYLAKLVGLDMRRRARQKIFDDTLYEPQVTPVDMSA